MGDQANVKEGSLDNHNGLPRSPAQKRHHSNDSKDDGSLLSKRRRLMLFDRLQKKLKDLQKIQLNASVELYYHQRVGELVTPQRDDSPPSEEGSESFDSPSSGLPRSKSDESKNAKNKRANNQRRPSRHKSTENYDIESPKTKSDEELSNSIQAVGDTLNESAETRYQEAAESLEEALQSADVKLIKLMEQEVMSQVTKSARSRIEEPQSEGQDDEDLLFDVNPADVEELLRDVNPEDVEKLLESEDMDAMLQEMTEADGDKSSLADGEKCQIIKNDSDLDGVSDSGEAGSDGAESDDECSSDEVKRGGQIKVENTVNPGVSPDKREATVMPEMPSNFDSSIECFAFMKLHSHQKRPFTFKKCREDVLVKWRGLKPNEREKTEEWKRTSDKLLINLANSEFVGDRIKYLNWHGLWSDNRLPKIAEMPRTRTHWDFLIEEMKWMSTDFVQEQRWRRQFCKFLSSAVVEWVPLFKTRAYEVRENLQRQRAKTIAIKVMEFWSDAETDYIRRSYPDVSQRLPVLNESLSDLKNAFPKPELMSVVEENTDVTMRSEESDDEEYFSLDNSEIIQKLKMCPKQRKLYDDYLEDPKTKKALASEDPLQLSDVLMSLVSICNYPNPHQALKSKISIPQRSTFPRIHDLWSLPKQILRATEYRPLETVCPRNFFEMFLPHESGYSVVVYDWLRKHYAKADKMRESGQMHDMHLVSFEECKWDKLSLSFKGQPKIKLSKENRSCAFHDESLDTLARMNAGRRFSEPLLGQDLCDSFTVLDTITPSLGRNLGHGYVNCLVASSEMWNKLATVETDATFSLKLPWTTMCLGGSGRSSKRKHCYNPRYITQGLEKLVKISARYRLPECLFEMTHDVQLAPSYSCTVAELQRRLEPNLGLLQREEKLISKHNQIIKPTISTQPSLLIAGVSTKIERLDFMLRKLRTKRRRSLVICRSLDMLDIVREHLKRSHFSFIFLDPEENEKTNIYRVQLFYERPKVQVLLVSAHTPVLGYVVPTIDCLIAVDMGIIGLYGNPSQDQCLINYKKWCKLLSVDKKPRIFRFVCEETVEDESRVQEFHKLKLLLDDRPAQTESPPAVTVVTPTPEVMSPLHRYTMDWMKQFFYPSLFNESSDIVLSRDQLIDDFWETGKDILDDDVTLHEQGEDWIDPILYLTYNDANKTWMNKIGDEMPFWYPGVTFEANIDCEFGSNPVSDYYKLELMEETDLPPVWVDDEPGQNTIGNQAHGQRSEIETLLLRGFPGQQMNGVRKKRQNQPGLPHSMNSRLSSVGSMGSSGDGLPKTLFHPKNIVPRSVQKQRDPTTLPPGAQPPTDATLAAVSMAIANLRHPVPRQQIAESGVPEWSPTEDQMLLICIKNSMRSRFHRNPFDNNINWSLVADVVNSVSHYYRSNEQCRKRFVDIVRPREEGRTAVPQPILPVPVATNPRKKKSGGTSGSSSGGSGRLHKTDELFQTDNNLTFTKLTCERFAAIKNVSNRRAPTTKPIVQMSVADLSESRRVLAENGIQYNTPIGPIELALRRQANRRQTQLPAAQDGQNVAREAVRTVTVAQSGIRPNQVGQLAVVGNTSTPIELVRQLRHPQPQQIQAHQLQAQQILRAQQLQAQARQQQPQQIRQITRQQLQPQVPAQRVQQIQQIRQQIALQQHSQVQQSPRQQSPQQTQSQQRPQTQQHHIRQQLTPQQVAQLQQQQQQLQQQLVVVQQPRQQSSIQTQQQRPQQLQLVVQQQPSARSQAPLQVPARPQPSQQTAQQVRPQQQQQQQQQQHIRPQQTLQVRPQQTQLTQQAKSTELSIQQQQQQQIRPQQYHRLQQLKQPQQVRLVHPQTQAKLIMRCDVSGQGAREGESRPSYQILTQENLQKVIHGITGQLVIAAPSAVVQQSNQAQTSSSVGQIIVNSQNMNIVNARVSGASSQAPTAFATATQAASASRANILNPVSTQAGRTISRIVPMSNTRQTPPRTTTATLTVGNTNLVQFQSAGLVRTATAGDGNLPAVRFQVAVGNNRVQGSQQGQAARSFVTAAQRQAQTVVPVHQIQQVVRSAIVTTTTPSITVVNTASASRAPHVGQQPGHSNPQHVVTLASLNHVTPVVVVQSPQSEAGRTTLSQQVSTAQVRIAPNVATIRAPSSNLSPIHVLTRPAPLPPTTTSSESNNTKSNPGFTKL